MSVVIKFLDKDSIDQVLNFFNTAQSDQFQTNNRSREEFEWLFIDSFYKPSQYAIASYSESGEIIGTNAGIFIPMLSKNSELIVTIKGEDTLISLDKMIGLGKRDILKELFHTIFEKSRDEKVKFMWGFTPATTAFKRCGFEIITRIKGSFYVTMPLKFYKNQTEKFPQLPLSKKVLLFAFSWYNYFNIRLKANYPREFSMKEISFNEIDEKAVLSFLPKNVCTTYLSKDFLRWRIKENPSPVKYRFLEFRNKNDTLVAYFIFSSNKQNIYFVEQFLFSGQFPDTKKVQIMKLALDYCRKQKAIMVRAVGFSHNSFNINEMKLLTRSGFHFFENPLESYFVFMNLSDSDIKPEEIYLSRLNTQGIR